MIDFGLAPFAVPGSVGAVSRGDGMKHVFLLAGVVCGLAACSPAGPATIQPGQYHSVTTFISITAPDMSADQIQAMKAQPIVKEQCITSDADSLKNSFGVGEGESCSENRITAAYGRIDGAVTCSDSDGTHSMQVTGNFTASHVEMDITVGGQTPQGQRSGHLRMTMDRTGDCAPADTSTDSTTP